MAIITAPSLAMALTNVTSQFQVTATVTGTLYLGHFNLGIWCLLPLWRCSGRLNNRGPHLHQHHALDPILQRRHNNRRHNRAAPNGQWCGNAQI